MIYGLYLSATGVVTNSHRQDVIANNLANAETTGFKRDLAMFKERLTEAQSRRAAGGASWGDPLFNNIGGGVLAEPTKQDQSQGDLRHTGTPLDVAIQGDGYFSVADPAGKGKTLLTRNGQFLIDREGNLVMSDSQGHKVLDPTGTPIRITGSAGSVTIGKDGAISQEGKEIGKVGVFTVAEPGKLTKQGATLFTYPDAAGVRTTEADLHPEFIEGANVEPTTELTELMDAQRQLEANANMIRYQDQTLQRLVNDVGRITA